MRLFHQRRSRSAKFATLTAATKWSGRLAEQLRNVDLLLRLAICGAFLLLLVGVRQSYAKSTAESELIKQYEFMHRIFRNARVKHDLAENDDERRHLLKILGDAALEEHAEWILMHRERAIDQKDTVRLG